MGMASCAGMTSDKRPRSDLEYGTVRCFALVLLLFVLFFFVGSFSVGRKREKRGETTPLGRKEPQGGIWKSPAPGVHSGIVEEMNWVSLPSYVFGKVLTFHS